MPFAPLIVAVLGALVALLIPWSRIGSTRTSSTPSSGPPLPPPMPLAARWLAAPTTDLGFPASASPSSSFSAAHNASMAWGTYRPGIFFGTKSRTHPESLVTGLMWRGPGTAAPSLRYECTQGDHDGIGRYGWKEHDGRRFGEQLIGDESGGVQLRTTFVKHDDATWAVRVASEALATKARPAQSGDEATLLYHLALDCEYSADPSRCTLSGGGGRGSGDAAASVPLQVLTVTAKELRVRGVMPVTGAPFRATFRVRGAGARLEYSAPAGHVTLDRLKSRAERFAFEEPAASSSTGSGHALPASATALLIKAVAPLPFSLELVFDGSGVADSDANEDAADAASAPDADAALRMAGRTVEEHAVAARAALDARFSRTFDGAKTFSPRLRAFTKCVLAEMLGGIGYWYGSSAVAGKSSLALAQRPLFSATPSRPKFPRGFLWDEGFHDLVIASWDPAIARDILSHWSGLITKGGWVAREQILGVEARGRVPGEFIPQHTTHANPPTLLLHLSAQIALLKGGGSDEAKNDAEIVAWLRSVVPALSRWFLWFVRSQSGETPGTFRWRGRTREEGGGVSGEKLHVNTLASGLDDYPRASHPDTRERHVDLYCWIARGAAIMADAAATLAKDDADDAAEWSAVQQRYAELHRTLVANLNRWHWDAVSKSYADFGSHIAGGKIDEFVVFRCAEESSQGTIDVALADGNCPASHPRRLYPLGDGAGGMMKRPVFIPPTNRRGRAAQPELGFVKHFGYVSLMPMMMRLLPPSSPQLGSVLALLSSDGDGRRLWTKYGLRSLSKSDLFYGQGNAPGDKPYWRGPIWMNMNYLALSGLHFYAHAEGPWQSLALNRYTALRKNLVNNVLKEWTRTGYLWEQYSEKSGRGQRSRPFSGWTALVAAIATESYY